VHFYHLANAIKEYWCI